MGSRRISRVTQLIQKESSNKNYRKHSKSIQQFLRESLIHQSQPILGKINILAQWIPAFPWKNENREGISTLRKEGFNKMEFKTKVK